MLERYLGARGYANAAERVVQGERLMQASSDNLARAHARTGDRIAIAGYLGSGDAADIAGNLARRRRAATPVRRNRRCR